MSELPDQLEAEPLKLVLLDQLIQVDGEQLEGDAGVRTEREVVEPANINQECINLLLLSTIAFGKKLMMLKISNGGALKRNNLHVNDVE